MATILLTIFSLAIVAYIITQVILSVRDRIITAQWEAESAAPCEMVTVSTSGRYADWSRVNVGTGSAATARHAA